MSYNREQKKMTIFFDHYQLVAVDDYARFIWTFFECTISEAFENFIIKKINK